MFLLLVGVAVYTGHILSPLYLASILTARRFADGSRVRIAQMRHIIGDVFAVKAETTAIVGIPESTRP